MKLRATAFQHGLHYDLLENLTVESPDLALGKRSYGGGSLVVVKEGYLSEALAGVKLLAFDLIRS